MAKKYLLMSLEDNRIKDIANILSNKTSNKIIEFLSERKEASEKDISDGLKIPLNTVDYNIKKMIGSGLVEETKNFFWSSKGKKIKMYRFSNKSIVISPKQKNQGELSSEIRKIIPLALISGLAALGIKIYSNVAISFGDMETATVLTESMDSVSRTANVLNSSDPSLWFLAGAIFVIILFVIRVNLYFRSWGIKYE